MSPVPVPNGLSIKTESDAFHVTIRICVLVASDDELLFSSERCLAICKSTIAFSTRCEVEGRLRIVKMKRDAVITRTEKLFVTEMRDRIA